MSAGLLELLRVLGVRLVGFQECFGEGAGVLLQKHLVEEGETISEGGLGLMDGSQSEDPPAQQCTPAHY